MRSLEAARARWDATNKSGSSVADLRRAVEENGPLSPCLSGCRSICWKAFLLSREAPDVSWAQAVRSGRRDYGEKRDRFLKFIEHPEALTELVVDPLADDPESPWNTMRRDEVIRAEIRQDVQRLPDEANYHQDRIQTMILNILFVYCKAYPSRGGYRQGMHELLAPIVHVVGQDAVDGDAGGEVGPDDESMAEALDSSFVEHDAYTLFSQLMEHAHAFYEVNDWGEASTGAPAGNGFREQRSAIVERSQVIHQVCLQKVDEELAAHLTSVDVLPQIFLIRWIRLLFSREFPFEQFLVLWDTIFAVDASLDLINLLCCAMLIRIRWQLLEADYSGCLQLLLKYPPPGSPSGPHTFVADAVHLRDHMNAAGGASLILKHTGREPGAFQGRRPSTPDTPTRHSPRRGAPRARSPLPSALRLTQQQAAVESLFQGAAKGAKGVLERGERLGINQAVRDAMVEIRRNIQGFNESRQSPRTRALTGEEDDAAKMLDAMQRRNKQLASLLHETVTTLRTACTFDVEDTAKRDELIEVATARIQFVQVYLEDSSMEVPNLAVAAPPEAPLEVEAREREGDSQRPAESPLRLPGNLERMAAVPELLVEADVGNDGSNDASRQRRETTKEAGVRSTVVPTRPHAMPTRSTLAQSSFSWMLEPHESGSPKTPPAGNKSPSTQQQKAKRLSNSNISRERSAFLFGDFPSENSGKGVAGSEDIFGMEPIQGRRRKS
ncbi:hypothetical protein RJ55_01282 [Drechmeria coniospora]|nr:hypothetical protein RJ55_01282 [Drechmeria coniospora]